MTRTRTGLNLAALGILAPVLLVSGVLGLVSPGLQGTSEAPAYDLFHIVFGAVGLWLVFSRNATRVRAFNVGFGLIDLYQALASRLHWFPILLFRWTSTDDAVHIVLGMGLVLIGIVGTDRPSERDRVEAGSVRASRSAPTKARRTDIDRPAP